MLWVVTSISGFGGFYGVFTTLERAKQMMLERHPDLKSWRYEERLDTWRSGAYYISPIVVDDPVEFAIRKKPTDAITPSK